MHIRSRWLAVTAIALVSTMGAPRAQSRQAAPPAAAKKTLALVGGMLLDGYEAPPLHHAAVLIEDNKIVAVGRAADVKIPPTRPSSTPAGRTMMPGMMDLHAHLMILGHGNYGAGSRGSPSTASNA